jgi:hypothetical protein
MKPGFEAAERIVSHCGRLLLAALLLFPSIAIGQAQLRAKADPATAGIRRFKVHVPDRILIDLRRRLAETKWPLGRPDDCEAQIFRDAHCDHLSMDELANLDTGIVLSGNEIDRIARTGHFQDYVRIPANKLR